MGIMEGVYSGALYLLGMPPELGVTIQLLRRLRAGFWAIVAFLLMGKKERHAVEDSVA